MTIRVLMFGILAQRTQMRELSLDLPDGATVADAVASLSGRWPEVAAMGGQLAYAVNMAYADAKQPLSSGDELALIPPVSGG